MSTGINRGVLVSVARVRASFRVSGSSELQQSGTGFWIRLGEEELAFATCRHILDPEMTGHSGCTFKSISILLRERQGEAYSRDTVWAKVIDCTVKFEKGADVAAILRPNWNSRIPSASCLEGNIGVSLPMSVVKVGRGASTSYSWSRPQVVYSGPARRRTIYLRPYEGHD